MPAIPGLALRPFAGEADFAAMAEVASASFAADRLQVLRTAQDLSREYTGFDPAHCDPALDVAIAEVRGSMAGYVRGWWSRQADGLAVHCQVGFVAPPWRRRGVGLLMQDWLEARQRERAAQLPAGWGHCFQSFVTGTEAAREALLRARGYEPARYFFNMVRPDLENLPDFPLPAGLELRPVLPAHYPALWQAHQEGFAGDWGAREPQPGDYEAWLADPVRFQPQLWQVAWDTATGEVAGQVRPYPNEHNQAFGRRRAWTEYVSVRPAWRGRGLARALVARALAAQKAAGLGESALNVDSDSPQGAGRLYEACGFRTVKRNIMFRKQM